MIFGMFFFKKTAMNFGPDLAELIIQSLCSFKVDWKATNNSKYDIKLLYRKNIQIRNYYL